jgi:hypothetical protein
MSTTTKVRDIETRMYWCCATQMRLARRAGRVAIEKEYRDELDVLRQYASSPLVRARCADLLGRDEASCAS